jgi:FG-GAP-like repeat
MTTTPRLSNSWSQANTTHQPAPMSAGLPSQDDGQVVALNDGGYVVVWTDFSRTYNSAGAAVIGQRYDSAGNKVGGEVKLSGFNSGDQFSPAVTRLDNGNIAVAFVDQFGGDDDIYVRIFDSSLSPVRTDEIDTGANQTFNPSITAFADSSYVISYTVGTGAATEVVARIVSPTGTVGAQFDIDSHNAPLTSEDLSELATLSNGNFAAVNQIRSSSADTDIQYTILSPTGTKLKFDSPVAGASGPGLETVPDVAALRDGGFVVVWTDPDSTVNDIRATIYTNTGLTTPATSNILVNTTTTGDQKWASVVGLLDGGFLVTWDDDSGPKFVRAQRFDAAGNKIGTESTVLLPDFFEVPQAALLTDGRIAYAVADGNVSGSEIFTETSIWRARDVSHDFDGDGKSGILWRHDSGQVYFWEMNGLSIKAEGGVAHAPVPTDWHIQGAGDFDGDGNNDVLWRHDSGQVYFWEMNGLQIKAEGGVAHAPVPNDWHIQGTGDFNADGKSDILWRHDSGQVYFWEMDGLAIKAEGGVAHAPVPNDWHIQDIGDFNGDGKSDLLWRHDSGQVYFWEMDGLQIKAEGAPAHAIVPNDWHVEGLGDFNGDGKSDILWRQDSGQVYFWEMDGLQIKAEGAAAHALVPTDWHIQDIGDYNADGKSDILWRHDSGQVYLWEMNGLQITAEGAVSHAAVPSDWHIFSQHNFV